MHSFALRTCISVIDFPMREIRDPLKEQGGISLINSGSENRGSGRRKLLHWSNNQPTVE